MIVVHPDTVYYPLPYPSTQQLPRLVWESGRGIIQEWTWYSP